MNTWAVYLPRLRFDNMTTAVAQVLRGTERSLTEGFQPFLCCTTVSRPSSVIRPLATRRAMWRTRLDTAAEMPLCRFPPLLPLKSLMRNTCGAGAKSDAQRDHYIHKIPIRELWQADADALLNLPDYPFTVFRYSTLTVSKTGFVVIDTNRYGLSPGTGWRGGTGQNLL